MNKMIITNNSLVYEKFDEKIEIVYLSECSYLKTLEYVRDMIHKGHKLLTHPLSGSLKPNETPFKSIAIGKKVENLDFEGLSIIENSIASAQKLIKGKPTPKYAERILEDFRLIDLSLIENAIKSKFCL
ncbi:GrdX family protein [Tepidibacter aestuarii]|uniref:GrdX family protein n=1 Tax=Tepidibacter aestuarii TaxID=2925782 RepID=UPI0020BF91F6|nr:GrdX family protein [Tepidibacter aestuarii]CAH2213436.1 GrdX protein [Tepidibacter aestuarii]